MAGEEGIIKNQILEFLNNLHQVDIALPYNQVQASKKIRRSKYQPVGIPDIIGSLKNGISLWIEVKTKTGRVSVAQEKFLEARRKSNCVAFVARSVDDVALQLVKYGY